MFLRIFPGTKFRLVLWGTQILNLLIAVVFTLVGIFQCEPVHLAWTAWSEEEEGHCIDMPRAGVCHGAINIGLDVWMLALPITQVLRLDLQWRSKFAVLSMFSMGLL
ncbi:hypothetical protein CCHL11_03555 [Colletotrichum chlorophyti]|uniref:Rhodopsin domain-containing protein n=1 Tax=Colletotrichum chlorophyti TaxID=708187 RepID=A0A1Q8RSL1_9PEZI|nr:hypothetical protein CCHL11_03555 [Colletotrichum chlorophyti]